MNGKKKILIVDDEVQLVEMLSMRLEASGYDVLTAFEGQEGLEKARNESPNLIILDLMLPNIDGFKVCGLLKNDARFKNIPIILFSAKAQEEDKNLGKEVGADAYIVKPFEPNILLEKVKELLGES